MPDSQTPDGKYDKNPIQTSDARLADARLMLQWCDSQALPALNDQRCVSIS